MDQTLIANFAAMKDIRYGFVQIETLRENWREYFRKLKMIQEGNYVPEYKKKREVMSMDTPEYENFCILGIMELLFRPEPKRELTTQERERIHLQTMSKLGVF